VVDPEFDVGGTMAGAESKPVMGVWATLGLSGVVKLKVFSLFSYKR